MPTSRAVFLPVDRRQAADVPLDERLDRREIEAADEDEREVTRVRKAVLVERQRLGQIHPIDERRSERPRPHVVLREGRGERSLERGLRQSLLVGRQNLELRRKHGELLRGRLGAP